MSFVFRKMRNVLSSVKVVLQPVLLAVLCAILLRAAVQAYSVPSESMRPALRAGDHILVTRLWREPRRGEVVVFRSPDNPQQLFVKRVIATPGDHLEIRDGVVKLNGLSLAEPYVLDRGVETHRPEIVPAGNVFVLGDHRTDSVDSRRFGFIPRERIVGRARLIFWSSGAQSAYPPAAALSSERARSARGIQWTRVLTPIR